MHYTDCIFGGISFKQDYEGSKLTVLTSEKNAPCLMANSSHCFKKGQTANLTQRDL